MTLVSSPFCRSKSWGSEWISGQKSHSWEEVNIGTDLGLWLWVTGSHSRATFFFLGQVLCWWPRCPVAGNYTSYHQETPREEQQQSHNQITTPQKCVTSAKIQSCWGRLKEGVFDLGKSGRTSQKRRYLGWWGSRGGPVQAEGKNLCERIGEDLAGCPLKPGAEKTKGDSRVGKGLYCAGGLWPARPGKVYLILPWRRGVIEGLWAAK